MAWWHPQAQSGGDTAPDRSWTSHASYATRRLQAYPLASPLAPATAGVASYKKRHLTPGVGLHGRAAALLPAALRGKEGASGRASRRTATEIKSFVAHL